MGKRRKQFAEANRDLILQAWEEGHHFCNHAAARFRVLSGREERGERGPTAQTFAGWLDELGVKRMKLRPMGSFWWWKGKKKTEET